MTSPSAASQVATMLDELASPGLAPGCAVGVARRGRLVFEGSVGLADIESKTPISRKTTFHVASVSKQFAAFALALAVRQAGLSMDHDVRAFLPEVPDFGGVITLENLVHHTSGLRDQWTLLLAAGWRMDDVITTRDVCEVLAAQRELNFEPSAGYSYTNLGYSLVAQVVERVTGASLRDFAAREIFLPLGMLHTHFHDDYEEIVPGRSNSYRGSEVAGFRKALLNYGTVGATSLHTTVHDLAHWCTNLGDGQVGGSELLEQMLNVGVLSDGTATGYAYGLIVDEYRGARRIHHGGADAAFTSFLMRFPDLDLDVIVLSNSQAISAPALAARVADAYLDDLGLPRAPRDFKNDALTTPQPQHAGLFVDARTGTALRLERRDDELVAIEHGQPASIEAVDHERLRIASRGLDFRFVESEGGMKVQTLNLAAVPFELTSVDAANPSAQELEEYAGEFWSEELDARYTVTVENGELTLHRRKVAPMPLQPTSQDSFIGTWGEGNTPLDFSVVFERADTRIAAYRLTFPRSHRLLFTKVATA